MAKFLAGVAKFIAVLLLLSAAAYAVILYWDKIIESLNRLKDALEEKKPCFHREQDDYADWDE